jgi:hypothetical protein
MKRVGATVVLASATLLACTFTRSLDYLQQPETGDGGSSTSGSTTSSTSSGGTDAGDAGSVGQLIFHTLLHPAHLVQDDANLYWTTDDNKVMKGAKTGGEPKELAKLTGDVGAITGLAIDPQGGTLFLLIEGSVKTLSRDGGTPADFLPGPDAMSIVADETFLFVLSSDKTGAPELRRYPKDNASQPTVISQKALTGETAGGAVALSKQSVFWTVSDANAVGILYEQPKTVATGIPPIVWKHTGMNTDKTPVGIQALMNEELAADDDGVYWIDDDNLVPYRLLRTQMQADAPALLNVQTSASTSITVDAKYMYVLDGKNLIRISKTNTEERTGYASDETSTEVVNDASAVYYVFAGDGVKATGGIYRIPK